MISDFGEEYIPRRMTEHSAGYDFYVPKDMMCMPDVEYMIDTGIHLEDGDLKDDAVMFLFPRSSLGFKHGFRMLNTTGVIDSDYRDSIKCKFTVELPLSLLKGDRFMQGVITRFETVPNEIPPVEKRTGGIGSTNESMPLSR